MERGKKFEFISPAEFARLDFAERDHYLRGALAELARRRTRLRPCHPPKVPSVGEHDPRLGNHLR